MAQVNHKGLNAEGPLELPYQSPTQLAATIANMKAMGNQWVRIIFSMSEMNSNCDPTQISFTNWDAVVNALNAAGLKTLAILGQTPACANGNQGAGWVPPSNNQSYVTNFMVPVVIHYAAMGVSAWEIWNEPDGVWDWPPAVNAAAYTDLLCKAYPAIHAIQPAATVISAGNPDMPFLTAMYAAGAHGCMDALDAHPYSAATTLRGGTDNWGSMFLTPQNATITGSISGTTLTVTAMTGYLAPTYILTGSGIPSNTTIVANGTGTGGTGTYTISNSLHVSSESMGGYHASMMSIMTANGDGAKPIWVTEVGCSTGGTDEPWFVCTPSEQAQMVSDAFNYAANGFPNLGPVFWFQYGDFSGAFDGGTCVIGGATGTTECYFGLYDGNGNPKPGVASFTSASGLW